MAIATMTRDEIQVRITEIHLAWDAKFADYRRDDSSWRERCNLDCDMRDLEREEASLRYQLKYKMI